MINRRVIFPTTILAILAIVGCSSTQSSHSSSFRGSHNINHSSNHQAYGSIRYGYQQSRSNSTATMRNSYIGIKSE